LYIITRERKSDEGWNMLLTEVLGDILHFKGKIHLGFLLKMFSCSCCLSLGLLIKPGLGAG
jgi:hypothetical protein